MKLLLTYSDQITEHIGHAVKTVYQSIDEILIFCQSLAEEKNCTGLSSAQYKTIVIDSGLKLEQQADRLKQTLQISVTEEDPILVLLQKQAHPLQLLLVQQCSTIFHNQTSFLAETERNIIPLAQSQEQNSFEKIEQHMREFVFSGNYRSAHNLIKDQVNNNEMKQLIRFGDQLFRLDFSYQASQGENHPLDLLVDSLLTQNIADGEEIHYLQELRGVEESGQKAFVYILHNYAEFLYDQGDIIDFIVLYYRIMEESLLFALGWDVDDQGHFKKRAGASYVLKFPEWPLSKHYHRYEKALRQTIRGIEERKKVKIRTHASLDGLTEEEYYFANLYLFLQNKGIKECMDFRHEGVSGHGFAELSKVELEEICGGHSPLQLLQPFLSQQGLLPEYSIFQSLNKAILALLATEFEIQ